ncbi:MAG TPA: hypothetical protein VFT80_10895 [Actinomycetota bacterium]|nr:hypothetical protein [Actinomycetota bacterium]
MAAPPEPPAPATPLEAREPAETPPPAVSRLEEWGPLVLVVVAVLFSLWVLRAEAIPVRYPNDAAVHRSMVAWAADRWDDGHLPLDGWYPDLALGSSRFHHYQSLPHVLTGLIAVPLGSERALAWTLYLLLSFWPVAVYAGGRLLGWDRWVSGLAALASPLIVSQPGLGYEYGSYVWRGYGTWTQLWGAWLLPFAWGLSWRAVDEGRWYGRTALVLALTIAVHLLTGYLALLCLGVFVLVRPTRFLERLGRAALVGFGSLFVAAWVVVPLLADRLWTVNDEFSRDTHYYDSFGAGEVMRWAVSGELFDRWRFPSLTILLAIGLLVALWRFRREPRARALLGVLLVSLLLFFGRPTLGAVIDLLPGSGDLFLRRYVFGVHLAGLYLIGLGTIRALQVVHAVAGWIWRRPFHPRLVQVAAAIAVVGALAPAWIERSDYAEIGGRWIREQRTYDRTDGADGEALLELADETGPGRMYAGARSNWGPRYEVGQVPMYSVLLSGSVEGVGFTRPTWSLSSPVEYRFQDLNPAHYDLFDVRYTILPETRTPPPGAVERSRSGRHVLWEMPTDGYVEVVDVLPAIEAGRTNLGIRTADWMRSSDVAEGRHPAISWEGEEAAPPTDGEGEVVDQAADLREGWATASVRIERRAAVLLKTSFDPRWRVAIDGEEARAWMLAPSFVGVVVPAGEHEVRFEYEPYPRYDLLVLLGAVSLAAIAYGPGFLRRRREGATEEEAPAPLERDPA